MSEQRNNRNVEEQKVTAQAANKKIEVLTAHPKAYFARASTNDNYPAERRELAHEMAEYIRTGTTEKFETQVKQYKTSMKQTGNAVKQQVGVEFA